MSVNMGSYIILTTSTSSLVSIHPSVQIPTDRLKLRFFPKRVSKHVLQVFDSICEVPREDKGIGL